jgi:hypothetical protein
LLLQVSAKCLLKQRGFIRLLLSLLVSDLMFDQDIAILTLPHKVELRK